MAKMIPEIPKEFDPKSKEGLMFEELSLLTDDYYVFHSFSIVTVDSSVIRESETDFVIFHPKKGIICLEAKAGQVDYVDGCWIYGSGKKMKKDGPYNQASANKWKLKEYMEEHALKYEVEHCKMLHAVWFPDVTYKSICEKHLPAEAKKEITLTSDSFGNINSEIERIFSLEIPAKIETKLSDKEAKRILERVLAPSFGLISLYEAEKEHSKHVFRKMLREQVALLGYLEEQRSAIINGLAGTGKTVMAVEKARLHSEKKEDVLFLCYNVFLKEYLKNTYKYPYVHYYTIDGLACKLCDTVRPNYDLLEKKLGEMYDNFSFPYVHVIIDEGQDFGNDRIDDADLIEYLKMNVIDTKENGTFYLFYDKNQMVQSKKIPSYIEDADCKLTLYKNCRNTQNIATTSMRLLGTNRKAIIKDGGVLGDIPEMGFVSTKEDAVKLLNYEIDKYIDLGYSSITILTCKTEEKSIIADLCDESKYRYKRGYIKFTTCRKFKGLESDIVIVIDIDKETFLSEMGEQLMYVGTSRARFNLICIVNMSEDDCVNILEMREQTYNKNIYKSFATYFNSKMIKNNSDI